jgi:hypothetical protein
VSGPSTDVQSALNAIENLNEESLDKLVSDLGIAEDSDNDSSGDITSPESQKVVDGGQQDISKPVGSETPKLTGQELLGQFQQNTEAQDLVRQQLNQWLADASAKADVEKQSKEFESLVQEGNFEEIGRRYVTAESENTIRGKAEEEALTKAYGDVYGRLFKELEQFELSDVDKAAIAPEKYSTDAEYVLGLSSFIAGKKSGSDIDALVETKVQERLTTLRNMKSATAATSSSVSSLPGGTPSADNNRPQTSRSLIQDGFHELLEEASNNRINQE